jgi:hypothetical protein
VNPWDVLDGFGGSRVIAVRADAIRLLGASTAILLSQFLYWQKRTKNDDGWFYNTQTELEEQTGLSVDAQQTARKQLIKLGVLEEKRVGIPSVLNYRLNLESLVLVLTPPNQESENLRICNRRTSESVIGGLRETVIGEPPIASNKEALDAFKDASKMPTNKHTSFTGNGLAPEPRAETGAAIEMPESKTFETQHLEFFQTLSGKEKFQIQKLLESPTHKKAYQTFLSLNPLILKDLLNLATKAQKVDVQTWQAWVIAVLADVQKHGLPRVQTAITIALLEPMEHPAKVWKFYQRVLEENRPETRVPLPRAEPKKPGETESAFVRELRKRKERDQIGRSNHA